MIAPAMIPLNLDEIGADFYGANCHKWLLAPTGLGFLHLGRGSEDRHMRGVFIIGTHRGCGGGSGCQGTFVTGNARRVLFNPVGYLRDAEQRGH